VIENTFDGELDQLRRHLKQISSERDWLREENARLRNSIRVRDSGTSRERAPSKRAVGDVAASIKEPVYGRVEPGIDRFSSERIHLFRSLFRGREDVFARLWHSSRTGRTGYSPACNHEWDKVLCGKPKVKCANCPNKALAPMTDSVILGHLQGKTTVGIYPLLADGTCHFLAVDFDKQSWKNDAAAFAETCTRMGVPAAMERSRSGNGAHIWVFFSGPVRASLARKLGSYLLTETMSCRHELGMDSYDRLFPNQDVVPKGGFGNLIALPLQKGPGESGNSLFVDAQFDPYKDQWTFFSSVTRMAPEKVEMVAKDAVRKGRVMTVRTVATDEPDQPWADAPSQTPLAEFPAGFFPSKVEVVLSNLIYIPVKGLPPSVVNQIKQLAAFQNPEFYKRQNLRLSTARTPRVICCSEDHPGHVAIPRGCLDELRNLSKGFGIELDILDNRVLGFRIAATFGGRLTREQAEASEKMLLHDDGVLVAPPGSGKTVIGTQMIAARGVNALVLVHRSPLMEQWRAQLANLLGLDPAEVGQIGCGKDKRSSIIDVAMLQSLTRKGVVESLVTEYGHVVIDECHHLPAVSFERVLRQVKARYVTGLTATPYRRDGHQPIILMQCGPVRYTIGRKGTGHDEPAKRLVIWRHTRFGLPHGESEPSIHDIYAALVADEDRNGMIIADVLKVVAEGRSPILLTERRDHLEFFANKLAESTSNVVVLHGGMGAKQRRKVAEQMSSIPEDEPRVLLATGRYIGEGFDDARLDTLFLAMPVSWKGTLVQYTGRLQRLHEGKTELRVYDYVDQRLPMLERMFRKRLRGYKALGYDPGG